MYLWLVENLDETWNWLPPIGNNYDDEADDNGNDGIDDAGNMADYDNGNDGIDDAGNMADYNDGDDVEENGGVTFYQGDENPDDEKPTSDEADGFLTVETSTEAVPLR